MACNICGKINQCRPCWLNDWIIAHQCEWCSCVVEEPVDIKGHTLCGSNLCEHLLFELLARLGRT